MTDLTLQAVETQFKLRRAENDTFFQTWLDSTPELTAEEKQRLDRARSQYFYLAEQPMLETLVSLVVLSPLLDLAGFYDLPFYFTAQERIAIGDGESAVGSINLLAIQDQLWFAVIETQWMSAAPEEALPYILNAMMGDREGILRSRSRPLFGLMTNGKETLFLRLTGDETLQYALSETFSMAAGIGNEFYDVLRGLKAIAQRFPR